MRDVRSIDLRLRKSQRARDGDAAGWKVCRCRKCSSWEPRELCWCVFRCRNVIRSRAMQSSDYLRALLMPASVALVEARPVGAIPLRRRLYQVAPISTNLILAYIGEHVLGLPRSY
mgnify:CR=1 FL=1